MATKSEREWLYVLEEQIKNQSSKLDSIEVKLDAFIRSSDERYVHVEEFKLVQRIVYGGAGIILTLFMTALVYIAAGYITP